jgi:hypothetical protein
VRRVPADGLGCVVKDAMDPQAERLEVAGDRSSPARKSSPSRYQGFTASDFGISSSVRTGGLDRPPRT